MTISNDKILKFEYDPVTNKWAFPVNDVGCVAPHLLAEYTGTPADASCVFVNTSTGNDSTGAGTQASPYKTIAHAISACDEDKTVVIVLNAATSSEDISGCTFTYFNGLYAASGVTHYLTFRVMETAWTDDNCIFVDGEAGNDDTGAGTQAAPYKTFDVARAVTTSSKKEIELMTDDVYLATCFAFDSDFCGVHSSLGKTPTLSIVPKTGDTDYYNSNTVIATTTLTNRCSCHTSQFPNGNILYVYDVYSGGSYFKYFGVYTKDGTTIVSDNNYAESGYGSNGRFARGSILSNGGYIVTYDLVTHNLYCKQYSAAHALERTIHVGSSMPSCGHPLGLVSETNNYVVCRQDYSTEIYYVHVYKGDDGSVINGGVSTGWSWVQDGVALNNDYAGYFVLAGLVAGSATQLQLYNPSGTCLKTENLTLYAYYNLSMYYDSDTGIIYVAWGNYNDGSFTILKYDETLTLISTHNYSTPTSDEVDINAKLVKVGDKLIYVFHRDGPTAQDSVSYQHIINISNMEAILLDAYVYGPTCIYSAQPYDDNSIIVFSGLYVGSSNYAAYMQRVGYYVWTGILGTVDAVIDGVELTTGYDYMPVLIDTTGSLTLSHCDISNPNYTKAATYTAPVITTAAAATINNSKLHDAPIGIVAVSSLSVLSYSQFYNITHGRAWQNTGAGSGIIIDHVDIFNCYGGLKLIDNNGSEVLKNSIIHDIDNYSVDAETAIDGDNCVITGISTGLDVSGSTRLFKANPLYINEGLLVPADIDLNIKIKLLGYPANSPAYLLADDGFNAGSHLVAYVGSETTWSSFTIIKPLGVPREIKPLNAVVNTKKSSAYKDGDTETITLNFATLTASEVEDLWKMLCCYRSGRYQYQVRLYPDPTTYPDVYLLCCLDPVNSYVRRSTDLYLWDDDYAQDSKIVLTRRFEVET